MKNDHFNVAAAAKIIKMRYSTAWDIMKYYRATGHLYRSVRDKKRTQESDEMVRTTHKKRQLIVVIEVPDRFPTGMFQ